ncbi:MAG: DUF2125 domain-containing protein [Pseudomonadota bacterium]|nr:DUF2125 domain-containing protein [Pseudomonadota bacterium]
MSFKATRLSILVLAATSLPALAATTQADADKVLDALKPYLGPAASQIKIQPLDDGYKATVDFTALFAPVKAKGIDASVSPIEITAKPLGGNKWQLHQEGDLSIAGKFPTGSFNEKVIGMANNATLDLDQGIITTVDATAKSAVVDEDFSDEKGKKINAHIEIDNISQKAVAKVNPAGGSDMTGTATIGQFTLVEHTDDGKQPVDINVKSTGGQFDVAMTGFKGKPLLDLWKLGMADLGQKPISQNKAESNGSLKDAFLGQNPSTEEQTAIKAGLNEALPLFQTIEEKGSFDKVEIATPLGPFGINKAGFLLKANGIVKDGSFEEGFSVEGLTIPPGLAPVWATGLVAQNSKIDFSLSGFDFATFAKGYLDAADFSKPEPVSKDVTDKLALALLPNGSATITLGPSSVSNGTYNLGAEGSFAAGPAAAPTGKAKITLSGLDDIMKIINAAPPEAGLQQAGAVMIMAKGLGKVGAGGSTTWDIEATPDGQVLVNGTDVKKLK